MKERKHRVFQASFAGVLGRMLRAAGVQEMHFKQVKLSRKV